jgi:hypothetical protein
MIANRALQTVLILGTIAMTMRGPRDYEILSVPILPTLLFLVVMFGVINERTAHEKRRG